MDKVQREEILAEEIRQWEERIYSYESSDFELLYQKAVESGFSLIPEEKQAEFFTMVDNMLFHLHAMIQGSHVQQDARERILSSARIFSEEIIDLEDMKSLSADQLKYIAEQQIARHRLYSFAQGGISGMGGAALMATDLPAIAVINLRLVQLIAMTYGYEVNTPKEMMISLKVFQCGTMPMRLQSVGLDELKEIIMDEEEAYFFEGNEEMANISWLEQPLKQVMKYLAISLLRKKKVQGLPLFSMVVGAGNNYSLTRRVSEFAHRFYQYRYLKEKAGA
ncbi:EcsC family protein [Bacillus testis]|uniref:EcsC family protein n=1 Tax=Bacillus testis TaxID=1622072 RepID=UPI00067ED852|nr:EcsC family protein [Bacillus testis]